MRKESERVESGENESWSVSLLRFVNPIWIKKRSKERLQHYLSLIFCGSPSQLTFFLETKKKYSLGESHFSLSQ